MKLTDGKKMIEVTMKNWNGSGYGPDMSQDLLTAGSMKYLEEIDAYLIDDVYAVEAYAQDWEAGEDEDTVQALLMFEGDENLVSSMRDEIESRCAETWITDTPNAYTAFITGGDNDGAVLDSFDDEASAIRFASDYTRDHADELDPVCGGVSVVDVFGNSIDW